MSKPIHIPEATHKALKKYATKKGCTLAEAASSLIDRALARTAAVDRYNAKRA